MDIVSSTISFVKESLQNAEGGHDWFHIERVYKNALHINKTEKGNELVVVLAALLHDIADSKFHNGDESIGPKTARLFLEKNLVSKEVIDSVVFIIENISYKGGQNNTIEKSLELKIVQDADRLDAIGAIGIARAFNYGGFKNRKLYDPEIEVVAYENKEAYKNSEAPTINHFYEKLLLLKELMNTQTGSNLAEKRHQFMEHYLDEFFKEWNAEL